MSIEAMKQALDNFQDLKLLLKRLNRHKQSDDLSDLISTLEAELAKPEQEPVAYVEKGDLYWCDDTSVYDAEKLDGCGLYPAPPRKEWVGLTEEEILDIAYQYDREQGDSDLEFARRVLVAQKEKNE